MKNLKIVVRLSLSMLLFLVPLAVALYFYYDNVTAQIDFAKQEKLGDAYLRPTVKILDDVSDLYFHKLRSESTDVKDDEVKTIVADINKDFEALKSVDEKMGADLKFTPDELKSRKRENAAFSSLSAKW